MRRLTKRKNDNVKSRGNNVGKSTIEQPSQFSNASNLRKIGIK